MPTEPELRVCSFGFLRAANSEAEDEEAAPVAAGSEVGNVALPFARRPLRPLAANADEDDDVVDDDDDDDDDDDELAEEDESVDASVLLSLLSLFSLFLDLVSESLELLVESRFLCVASTLAAEADDRLARPDDNSELLPPVAFGNEWRLVFDLILVLHWGLRGGIGVQGRLVLAATATAASCAARTASISDSGAL